MTLPALASGRIDLVTIGETMALLSPMTIGPLSYAPSLRLSIGGAESNVAIGARRLGLRVAWIGRVGADDLGELIMQRLRGEDVQIQATVDTTRPTGIMVKVQRTTRVARVRYYRDDSAGSRLCVEDLDVDLIASARVLHVSGITPALSDTAREAVHAAVDLARRSGVTVSVDYNYRQALWDSEDAAKQFRALTAKADIVLASQQEAAIVVGAAAPSALAQRIADLGPTQVLVKLGSQGAVGWIDGEVHEVSAVPVIAVDHVGAGDAFAAGYITAMLSGDGPLDRLIFGARVGAYAVTVHGDWEGLPTIEELESLDSNTETVIR